MTVAMIIPSHDMVHMDFAMAAWALMAHQKNDFMVLNPRTSVIQISRYNGVQKAIEQGASHVFFVDSDLTFPADALERLMAHDVPIVAATYMKRALPETVLGVPFEDITSDATGLMAMRRMPIGFGLIRIDVFDKIDPPWFPVTWDPALAEHTSEDYNFCELAREAGFKLLVDLDLSHELGHIGTKTFKWNKPK